MRAEHETGALHGVGHAPVSSLATRPPLATIGPQRSATGGNVSVSPQSARSSYSLFIDNAECTRRGQNGTFLRCT